MRPTVQITSAANTQYRIFLSLLTSKGIKKEGLFFLMGEKLIQEFLLNPNYSIEYLIYTDLIPSDLKLPASVKFTQMTKELFQNLDSLGTSYPLLVLKYQPLVKKNFNQAITGLELITPLGDPKNLGSLTRSALAFRVKEVILTQESTNPFLPTSIKASSGAVLKMQFTTTTLKVSEIPIVGENYALDLKGSNIQDVRFPNKLRLWVGEEGPGLNFTSEQRKSVNSIYIPTSDVESLNATVSTSIAVWEWYKQNYS